MFKKPKLQALRLLESAMHKKEHRQRLVEMVRFRAAVPKVGCGEPARSLPPSPDRATLLVALSSSLSSSFSLSPSPPPHEPPASACHHSLPSEIDVAPRPSDAPLLPDSQGAGHCLWAIAQSRDASFDDIVKSGAAYVWIFVAAW